MTVPSALDLKKREDKLKQFLKKLNEDGSPQEKHVVSVVRSAIRKAWMKSDVKLAYLYSKTIPDMDDNTRTKWLVKCEICEGLFKLADIEIDHKEGNHSFLEAKDFKNYFDNILMVNFDGLQVLCKEGCHATKSYMEKYGCTWEEAVVQKEAISIIKSKKELSWLKERGIVPASNTEKRRKQIIEELSK